MRLSRRKLTLQLTPLLDLLLIVFFAQYMEMQRLTAEVEARSREEVATAQQEITEARGAVAAERELLRQEEGRLTQRAAEAEGERRVVAELAAELFRVPSDLAREALQPEAGTVLTPEEVEKLREQLRELGAMRADELVRHLLTYNELRKRADVWDLYIGGDGVVSFDSGERSFTFRASTPDDFAAELFQSYKTLPQPKGLVIMLLSYGDITELRAQAARNGLRLAAERMRDDSGQRSRFEYAILGLRPRAESRDQ